MKIEQNVLGFPGSQPGSGKGADAGQTALNQAAARISDTRRGAPKFRTKDLVGLLLSHGARTWRNTMPKMTVRVRVNGPTGKPAVRLRVGA